MEHTAIWWIRRDLRLGDNPALQASLERASRVIPLFIVDPALADSSYLHPRRLAFLLGGLRRLDEELRARGSRLVLRRGNPLEVMQAIFRESGAQAIFAEADFSPYARKRDREIVDQLPLQLEGGPVLSHPDSILKTDGSPYTVFTPYMRAWKAAYHPLRTSLIPAPVAFEPPPALPSDNYPEVSGDSPGMSPPGESEARQRLKVFLSSQIYAYAEQRNRLDLQGTSQLSPYLRFGMLSARQAVVAAFEAIAAVSDSQATQGAQTWLNELIWREFYTAILYHFPFVLKQSFRREYRDLEWANDPADFEAWCQGKTGVPVVDAAMRQLRETGWMHNRARMIVASFLVKDLLIDWRWGEGWFMKNLVDGDPAANNGGWQWTAGTGTDAAPYFRIFNPTLQGKKFDPDGKFVKTWVPELAQVPAEYLHAPWEMPYPIQEQSACIIGQGYPHPLVDHAFARQRTLAAFKAAREIGSYGE